MKLIRRLKDEKTASFLKHVVGWIIGGAIGAIFGAFFTGNYIWSIVFAISLTISGIAYVITVNRVNSKCDIVKIMKDELSAGNYIQVIRMGYPLSRPLHLSGRNTLRYQLGYIVLQACNHLQQESIRIDDKKILISYIKAKTLIDDLGWTAFRLGYIDLAQENINDGIIIAKEIKEFTLSIKGYRHLIGILDELSDYNRRNDVEKAARVILEGEEYKKSFSNSHDYDHAVAEFDYAIAKTLIDDEPERALDIAKRVQLVFSNEVSTDMDRYVKTFDLIGDIYANYTRPEKLKMAKSAYLTGISKSEEYGRSERLIKIAIDYIRLLIKMIDSGGVYDDFSWEGIDTEELAIFQKALDSAIRTEDKSTLADLKRTHKLYTKRRKGH